MDEHNWRPLGRRLFIRNGLGFIALRADRVIEDQDASGPDGLLEELYDLRVEGLTDLLVVVPLGVVCFERLELEALLVGGEGLGVVARPAVVDRHFVRAVAGEVHVFGFGAFVKIDLCELFDVFGVVEVGSDGVWG